MKFVTKAQRKFSDVGGISTCYIEAGHGDPLILLHGGGPGADSYSNWRGCIPAFAEHFHVYAVDAVGFGHSDKPDPDSYDYSQRARNNHIISFIETLGLDRINLIGNSMGGAASIAVAVEVPEQVNKIVLMGAAAIKAPISDELKSILHYDFTSEGMRRVVQGLTGKHFKIDAELEKVIVYRHELSLDEKVRNAYGAFMAVLRDKGGMYYEEDYIRRVVVPTLIVNGKDDLVVPISSAYRLLELIKDSWGYIIPNCGHWAMVERRNEFIQISLDFLLGSSSFGVKPIDADELSTPA